MLLTFLKKSVVVYLLCFVTILSCAQKQSGQEVANNDNKVLSDGQKKVEQKKYSNKALPNLLDSIFKNKECKTAISFETKKRIEKYLTSNLIEVFSYGELAKDSIINEYHKPKSYCLIFENNLDKYYYVTIASSVSGMRSDNVYSTRVLCKESKTDNSIYGLAFYGNPMQEAMYLRYDSVKNGFVYNELEVKVDTVITDSFLGNDLFLIENSTNADYTTLVVNDIAIDLNLKIIGSQRNDFIKFILSPDLEQIVDRRFIISTKEGYYLKEE